MYGCITLLAVRVTSFATCGTAKFTEVIVSQRHAWENVEGNAGQLMITRVSSPTRNTGVHM